MIVLPQTPLRPMPSRFSLGIVSDQDDCRLQMMQMELRENEHGIQMHPNSIGGWSRVEASDDRTRIDVSALMHGGSSEPMWVPLDVKPNQPIPSVYQRQIVHVHVLRRSSDPKDRPLIHRDRGPAIVFNHDDDTRNVWVRFGKQYEPSSHELMDWHDRMRTDTHTTRKTPLRWVDRIRRR